MFGWGKGMVVEPGQVRAGQSSMISGLRLCSDRNMVHVGNVTFGVAIV